MANEYPIGIEGKPWGTKEKTLWLNQQPIKRQYADEVLVTIDSLRDDFELAQYGTLPYDQNRYPLYIAKTKNWQASSPTVLVTGGVHGYETSGVQGALGFLTGKAKDYESSFNLVVAPCISPWGYETINRWNPDAIDPNRSFMSNSLSAEASQIMAYVNAQQFNLLAHFDLHETTDTDNSEFRPALAARDAVFQAVWDIPDGFYTVDDSSRPKPAFQKAIIDSVESVTHIAQPDDQNKIIGADVAQKGVINYNKRKLFLCGGFTTADYVTTTEVYPDSSSATPRQCIDAQIAAICGGLNYLMTRASVVKV